MKHKTLLIAALAIMPFALPTQAEAQTIGVYYSGGKAYKAPAYKKQVHKPKVAYKKSHHYAPVKYQSSYGYKQASRKRAAARGQYFNGYRYAYCPY